MSVLLPRFPVARLPFPFAEVERVQTAIKRSFLVVAVWMTLSGNALAHSFTAALIVAGDNREASLAEAVPGYESVNFYGLAAPKSTPPSVISLIRPSLPTSASEKVFSDGCFAFAGCLRSSSHKTAESRGRSLRPTPRSSRSSVLPRILTTSND